jgi:endonuclease/exonuclease/phosphatase (EEP) superfamily protein YafD
MPAVDDWIYFRGAIQPMTFDVAHCASAGLPPSDHRPVLATFLW